MFTKFFLVNLYRIHEGGLAAKFLGSIKIAAVATPFLMLAERLTKWTLENEVYISWVLYAILADWLVGTGYHFFKKKDFHWGKNFMSTALKIMMVLMCGSLYEALPHFIGENNIASNALLATTRLSVFMYPAGSAWMNMSAWTDGKFPPTGWIKKIKGFEDNLKLEEQEVNNG